MKGNTHVIAELIRLRSNRGLISNLLWVPALAFVLAACEEPGGSTQTTSVQTQENVAAKNRQFLNERAAKAEDAAAAFKIQSANNAKDIQIAKLNSEAAAENLLKEQAGNAEVERIRQSGESSREDKRQNGQMISAVMSTAGDFLGKAGENAARKEAAKEQALPYMQQAINADCKSGMVRKYDPISKLWPCVKAAGSQSNPEVLNVEDQTKDLTQQIQTTNAYVKKMMSDPSVIDSQRQAQSKGNTTIKIDKEGETTWSNGRTTKTPAQLDGADFDSSVGALEKEIKDTIPSSIRNGADVKPDAYSNSYINSMVELGKSERLKNSGDSVQVNALKEMKVADNLSEQYTTFIRKSGLDSEQQSLEIKRIQDAHNELINALKITAATGRVPSMVTAEQRAVIEQELNDAQAALNRNKPDSAKITADPIKDALNQLKTDNGGNPTVDQAKAAVSGNIEPYLKYKKDSNGADVKDANGKSVVDVDATEGAIAADVQEYNQMELQSNLLAGQVRTAIGAGDSTQINTARTALNDWVSRNGTRYEQLKQNLTSLYGSAPAQQQVAGTGNTTPTNPTQTPSSPAGRKLKRGST